jgi:hypothetical protein
MIPGRNFQALKHFWENTTFFNSSRTGEQGDELVAKNDAVVTASDSGVAMTEL